MQSKTLFAFVLLAVLWPIGALATDAPILVAPGDRSGLDRISDRCPTFHWGAATGARSVELVIYRLPDEESGENLAAVMQIALPGSAQGWTPALDRCLERGGRYAWSIRAVGEQRNSNWSGPSFFQVAAGPNQEELEQALAVLRAYRAESEARDASGAVETEGVGGQPSPSARPSTPPPARHAGDSLPTQAAPTLGAASLSVDGQIHLGAASAVFKEGFLLLQDDSTTASTSLGRSALDENFGTANTALGTAALSNNEGDDPQTPVGEGKDNTAVGYLALFGNETGSDNTAVGRGALENNLGDDLTTEPQLEGWDNTAVGSRALNMNTLGWKNTGVGAGALGSNDEGDFNVGVGADALQQNENGDLNVAVGDGALRNLRGGKLNVAVGASAGVNLNAVDPENSNILLNNLGTFGESNTLRVGEFTGSGDRGLDAAYIHGIYNKDVAASAALVYVDSTGKLGTNAPPILLEAGGVTPAADESATQRMLRELEGLRRQIRELQAEIERLKSGGDGG